MLSLRDEALALVDTTTANWQILYAKDSWEQQARTCLLPVWLPPLCCCALFQALHAPGCSLICILLLGAEQSDVRQAPWLMDFRLAGRLTQI